MSGDGRIAALGGTPAIAPGEHRPWPPVGDEERRAVLRVLERGVLSGASAPECVAFERDFAAFVGVKHALLTHSGTSALHLALAAAGVSAGDHVLVPAYSFIATPLAVLHAGGIPIFADVDPQTGLMTPETAEEALTKRCHAVMPVHVHGCAADLDGFRAFAGRHGLALVEDAAQAHGATWAGRPAGSAGVASGFSLQSSKNLGVGEGGVFVTNDDGVAENAQRIRNFGQDVALADRHAFDADRPLDGTRPLLSDRIGWMYRGSELAAALGRAQLAALPERTRACQENAAILSTILAELPGVVPPVIPSGATSVHHKYRVRLDPARAGLDVAPRVLRDAIAIALRAEGLDVVSWQTAPLPAQPIFRTRRGYGDGWPWSTDPETDFSEIYDPSRFANTRALLDGSLVLFSQSCPLIAQPRELVRRYGEAFARVWAERRTLIERERA